MAQKKLTELGQRFKKVALTAKQYTDDQLAAAMAAEKVNLIVKGTANAGYAKTYILAAGVDTENAVITSGTGKNLIGYIDIPKDYLVKSAKLLKVETVNNALTVTAENGTALAQGNQYAAPAGVTAGGQWLDFVVNTKADGDDSTVSDQHICINVTTLFDDYFSGNAAISITNHQIGLQLGDNPNGLKITSGKGLDLDLAVASTGGAGGSAGAQTAAGKEQEEHIANDITLMTNGEIISWFGYDPSKMTTAGTSEKALADAFSAADFNDSITSE